MSLAAGEWCGRMVLTKGTIQVDEHTLGTGRYHIEVEDLALEEDELLGFLAGEWAVDADILGFFGL